MKHTFSLSSIARYLSSDKPHSEYVDSDNGGAQGITVTSSWMEEVILWVGELVTFFLGEGKLRYMLAGFTISTPV